MFAVAVNNHRSTNVGPNNAQLQGTTLRDGFITSRSSGTGCASLQLLGATRERWRSWNVRICLVALFAPVCRALKAPRRQGHISGSIMTHSVCSSQIPHNAPVEHVGNLAASMSRIFLVALASAPRFAPQLRPVSHVSAPR